jgi:hypothetical protein
MKKKSTILDPLWITQGSYLDPEYFSYVLMAAAKRFKEDLESGDLEHFYEVLFHSLNLNNLAVDGNLFDFKMKPYLNTERINKIKDDLAKIYEEKTEVVEIFKNANYVFLNLLLEYMDEQIEILSEINILTKNTAIHNQSEVFIIAKGLDGTDYPIWKLKFNKRLNFGYSLKKVATVQIEELRPNVLREALDNLDIPELKTINENKNVCFIILNDIEEKLGVNVVKDCLLINRFVARDNDFHGLLILELQELIVAEKLVPFTLNQWFD